MRLPAVEIELYHGVEETGVTTIATVRFPDGRWWHASTFPPYRHLDRFDEETLSVRVPPPGRVGALLIRVAVRRAVKRRRRAFRRA